MNVVQLRPREPEGKIPAHDEMAEAATLAACMLKPEVAATALAIASPEDFYLGSNQVIAKAIAGLVSDGAPIDMATVAMRVRAEGNHGRAPMALIAELVDSVPAIHHVERYATTVRELATVRRLAATMQALAAECYEPIADVGAFLSKVDAAIGEATRAHEVGGATPVLEATVSVARKLTETQEPVVTTGYRNLDRVTRGFEAGCLYVLGARTGMGKTAMATAMAVACAEAGHEVLFVSLEMGREQLVRRMVCQRAAVPLSSVRDRQLTQRQWTAFTQASSDIARMPLRIADRPAQNLLTIRSHLRGKKPKLVIVDHLGLVKAKDGRQRNRTQEVGEISRGLKELAMGEKTAVLALCQVGRDVAKAARRPLVSDLRESGDIEQDADGIWLLHRPGYYDPRCSPEVAAQAELIVGKQRDGETPILPMRWVAEVPCFEEVSW